MISLFNIKNNINLNRLYKGNDNILLFPIAISKSTSKTNFDKMNVECLGTISKIKLVDKSIQQFEYVQAIRENGSDKMYHKYTDYRNNLVLCINLSEYKFGNVGDKIYVPMADFTDGDYEEVIGYTNKNVPVTNSELDSFLLRG